MFFLIQIPLHSVQCLSAVLPDGASSPATRPLPPPGPLTQAGGPESGGGGRPGPQLEGGTNDASDPMMLFCLSLMNKSGPDSAQSHAVCSFHGANEPAAHSFFCSPVNWLLASIELIYFLL